MLGKQAEYVSGPIKFNKADPPERFTARYPTNAELIAQRQAILGLKQKKDKPGDPEPDISQADWMRVNFESVLQLLTGYSIDGITVEDFDWREALLTDGRYMEVVAAIGFELFRGAAVEGDS